MRIPNVQVAGLNIPLPIVVPVLPVQAVASGPQRAVAQGRWSPIQFKFDRVAIAIQLWNRIISAEPDPDLNVLIAQISAAQISAAQITGVQIADEQDSNVQVRDVHVTGQEVLEASDPDVQVGELEVFQNYGMYSIILSKETLCKIKRVEDACNMYANNFLETPFTILSWLSTYFLPSCSLLTFELNLTLQYIAPELLNQQLLLNHQTKAQNSMRYDREIKLMNSTNYTN